MEILSDEQIALLTLERDYPVPEQFGPLRHFDRTLRCASRGCASPTNFKLQGIPYCMIHSMKLMNTMLYERGVES